MEDTAIIELYWAREERAIQETDAKYGPYCRSIAMGILHSHQDTEECVSDTWLSAWNAMPPHRPSALSAFLGRITRGLSIDRWRQRGAKKRGGDQMILALEELGECVSGTQSVEEEVLAGELVTAMHRFLDGLPRQQRQIFLLRYWYIQPVSTIARRFGLTENHTAVILHRVRQRLRTHLEKEGYL